MTDRELAEKLFADVPKEYLDDAIKELLRDMQDITEFYITRYNYNPEPLPEPETITLVFDDG